MAAARLPVAVSRVMAELGQDLSTWRKLRHLTAAEVADRAGIAVTTLLRLEKGQGSTLENFLRVTRALGVLDQVAAAIDPYASDVGRMRSDETLPARVRHRKTP